ncbi:MAG: serine/threonine protein kinase [Candidatus Sericytochromatia bacterium]
MQPADLIQPMLLASGSGTEVYRALDPRGRPVLLKRFFLKRAGNWKEHDLFEREAAVLERLEHPRIPQLLAHGQDEESLYLITPWIAGDSLAERLERGQLSSEAEILELAGQLLEILVWLHGQSPPVIHRDIKPSNLILNPDGELYLIDFGSVLLRLNPEGGSTVAGTFGYMAPEQFSGRALPASDLYALGATLVHLLSGRAPAEIPQDRLRLRFEAYVHCSADCRHWLARLLAPAPEERFASALDALRALSRFGPGNALVTDRYTPGSWLMLQPPDPASGIRLEPTAIGVEIVLPALALQKQHLGNWSLRRLPVGGLMVLTLGACVGLHLAPPLLPLMLPLLADGLYDGSRLLRLSRGQTHLRLDAHHLEIEVRLNELTVHRQQIARADVLDLRPATKGLRHVLNLIYLDGFGTQRSYALCLEPEPEVYQWLSSQIQAWRNGESDSVPCLPQA